MQVVRLATTRVTSPAASHASLVRRMCLYTIYPIVARALGLAAAYAFRPIVRASKGILHTTAVYEVILYARYLCSRDALGLKAAAGRPSAARDDRVSCIQEVILTTT